MKPCRESSAIVSEYRYDGLGRRIAYRHNTDLDALITDETWYFFAYDDQWRIIAVLRDGDSDVKESFVWHAAGPAEWAGRAILTA
jgi:hypothetical protein